MSPLPNQQSSSAQATSQNSHATRIQSSLWLRLLPSSLLTCGLITASLIAGQPSHLFALTPVTEVVVKTGDAAPDGDGAFSEFSMPALNNHGAAGFRGTLNQSARGSGLFLGDGGTLIQVARTSDPALGGSFQGFSIPALNDPGQLLFLSSLVVNSRRFNLIRSEPQRGAFTELLADGQPPPGGNGSVSIASINEPPALNQSGQAAFVAGIANTSGGSTDDSAIYRTSTANSLTQIVREGQNVPEGNGKFGQISAATLLHTVLNESGQVAFLADLTNTSGGSADNSGIYRGSGNTLVKIARAGELLPGGGTLVWFGTDTSPDLNDSGEVVFPLSLNGDTAQEAIFKGSGGGLTEIARSGEAIPNSADTYRIFEGFARINNAGQVAFIASITPAPGSDNHVDFAIFRGDGTTAHTIVVVRQRQSTPGRTGIFSALSSSAFCFNNSGQLAFSAGLDVDPTNNTPVEEHGIYFFDQSRGLSQVARENDSFLGSKITALTLAGTSLTPSGGIAQAEQSGLNEAGQVAFGFTLADGRNGIAIWSPTLQLLSAVSRKTQGTAGNFDIGLPLSGKLGVECRSGGTGGNYTLVLTFTNKLQSGHASVTSGLGSVSGTPKIAGHNMTVKLTGVSNAQKIVVTVSNVTDKSGRVLPSAKIPMGVLLGDVTGNKSVDAADVNSVQAQVGAAVVFANFRNDVKVNGAVNKADVTATQAQVGTSIP